MIYKIEVVKSHPNGNYYRDQLIFKGYKLTPDPYFRGSLSEAVKNDPYLHVTEIDENEFKDYSKEKERIENRDDLDDMTFDNIKITAKKLRLDTDELNTRNDIVDAIREKRKENDSYFSKDSMKIGTESEDKNEDDEYIEDGNSEEVTE